MKNLYNPNDLREILSRIDTVADNAQRQWGKMMPAQMLAHCSAALEVAVDKKKPKRMFIGYILGPLFKPQFYNEKNFNKNGPTDPNFVISDTRDMELERTRLKALVNEFASRGPEQCTKQPHTFFGYLTPEQWSIGMYKHLDHHLRQFSA